MAIGSEPRVHALVAEVLPDGVPAGPDLTGATDGGIWLEDLFVRPAARGLGQALLDEWTVHRLTGDALLAMARHAAATDATAQSPGTSPRRDPG